MKKPTKKQPDSISANIEAENAAAEAKNAPVELPKHYAILIEDLDARITHVRKHAKNEKYEPVDVLILSGGTEYVFTLEDFKTKLGID